MKAFFYFPVNIDIYPDSSITKKNKHIISSINRLGIETDVISFSNQGILFNEHLLKKIPNHKLSKGLFNNLLAFNIVKNNCDFSEYDFAWIRAGLTLPPQLSLIREIKKQNPKIKILLEYGSFPFYRELFGYHKLLIPFHKRLTKHLKKYVSFIITYCGQEEIYGIPTIKIGNGIDVTQIEYHPQHKSLNGDLNLISVSGMQYWHGLDRVIDGLKNYYQDGSNKLNVIFHIVGESQEKSRLEKMVFETNLDKKVIFHGFKIKDELNKIFEQSDLAIGTLGMHRKNLLADSSLKNREYFARGLPFVLAMKDDDFPQYLPYIKYIPSDESAVNINSLIEFYKNLTDNYPKFNDLIRKYAEDNLTWESKLKQVLKIVNS